MEAIPLPAELQENLDAHFVRTREHFQGLGSAQPDAIILGGGYGRGEGGIAVDASGQSRFFNDLDYFVFTEEPQNPTLLSAVADWEKRESDLLGIDVEGKCLPQSQLNETPTSMMFFDLVSSHQVVLGPPDFLEPYRKQTNPQTIARIEATRLLWNRGSGLLFARADLLAGESLDIVHRNQAKAKLAMGDALLTIRGLYRPFVRERQLLLREEADIHPRIAALHEEGTAFKLRPTRTPDVATLQETQAELTALWISAFLEVESARLGVRFHDAGAYAKYRGRLFPETNPLRNLLLALRDRLKRNGNLRPATDYPRGALQRALVLLLEPEPDFRQTSRLFSQSILDLNQAARLYTKWWHHYS